MKNRFINKLALSGLTLAFLAACTSLAPQTKMPISLQAQAGAQWFKLPTEAYKGKQDDVFFVDANLGFTSTVKGKSIAAETAG